MEAAWKQHFIIAKSVWLRCLAAGRNYADTMAIVSWMNAGGLVQVVGTVGHIAQAAGFMFDSLGLTVLFDTLLTNMSRTALLRSA